MHGVVVHCDNPDFLSLTLLKESIWCLEATISVKLNSALPEKELTKSVVERVPVVVSKSKNA